MRGKRRRNVHVVPAGLRRKFVAKVAGEAEALTEPTTQREAIREAVREAKLRSSEVVIHRGDGRIRDSDSYGSDPEEVRDSKH